MICPKCSAQMQDDDHCPKCGYSAAPQLQNKNNVWFKKPPVILLALMIFFPAGLYLMWKYSRWEQAEKVIMTAFIGVVLVGSLAYNFMDNQTAEVYAAQSSQSVFVELSSDTISIVDSQENPVSSDSAEEQVTGSSVIGASSSASRASYSKAVSSKAASSVSNKESVSAETSSTSQTSSKTNTSIKLTVAPGTVVNGTMATLTILGKPNTQYQISVYYTSKSTAAGLEPKTSDKEGNVTWTWKVSTRTKAGEHRIVVTDGTDELETSFITMVQ